MSISRHDAPASRLAPEHGRSEVKVIASSLRKGNVVDMDGKLYVVMNAENIHPGKQQRECIDGLPEWSPELPWTVL